jgi:hypothetical protein
MADTGLKLNKGRQRSPTFTRRVELRCLTYISNGDVVWGAANLEYSPGPSSSSSSVVPKMLGVIATEPCRCGLGDALGPCGAKFEDVVAGTSALG